MLPGRRPDFGAAVGNPRGALGCSTSAESVVDDAGVIRRVQGEAQIQANWSSAAEGSVSFAYSHLTRNVLAGSLTPAQGTNFGYTFVPPGDGVVRVNDAVSGTTQDLFPFFMYDIRLYKGQPTLPNLREFRLLYASDLLAGASGQHEFPILGGQTYILTIGDGGTVSGGLGDRLGSATGSFTFQIQAIPEPGTCALMSVGLLAIAAYARRMRGGHGRTPTGNGMD